MILDFHVQEVANMKIGQIKILSHPEHKELMCKLLLKIQKEIAELDND